MKKNLIRSLIIGNIAALLISLLVFVLGMLQTLSHSVFDYSQQWSMSHEPNEDVVVVGIDESSIKELGGTFPFNRKVYVPFLRFAEQSGAKAIAFDITFTGTSNPESDKAFADELGKYKNVILPSYANLEGDFNRSTKVKKDELIMARNLQKPIPEFADVSQTAHINRTIDDDGIVRRNWLKINTPEGEVSSLAFKAAEIAGAKVDHYLKYNPQTELLIDYSAITKDFMTIPFSKVVKSDLPKDIFKDRIVLVGFTGPATDEGATPVEKHMNLVYVHANLLSQLLNNQYIHYADKWLELVLIVLMLILIGFIAWKLKPVFGLASVFGFAVLLLFIQFYFQSSKGIIINVVDPIAAGFVSYLVNIAIKTFFETKQKNYITKQFGRYISPDLVKEIAQSGQEIKLGGISRDITILFLDIRGFTPLSEKLSPEEVVDFLNMMFNLITERALENHATIDKFIGDAAMLLYNAPLDVPNHAYYAVKTAYEIQQGMVQVREDILKKHGVSISVGIGINSGNSVVGNIGSYLRVDYTAIGDNVNTAARIESNTQPNQILVSEETYERTNEYFEFNCIGEKTVKGKSLPLKLFEVVGIKKTIES